MLVRQLNKIFLLLQEQLNFPLCLYAYRVVLVLSVFGIDRKFARGDRRGHLEFI